MAADLSSIDVQQADGQIRNGRYFTKVQ
jgi:hypothetical protein